ncbi:MAG: GNAT family N-acetyltransferase [Saprospiraceae bacterium]|nr:GNAT family N-acetyltransferase [Saprospiraceae bacterium]MCB9326944.1 GNAT family N-acetyltransferase [Lewinellaceae bacterium]
MDKSKRALYNDFCEKAGVPVFARDWYLDSACEGGRWDVVFEEEDGEVIAALPYFIKKKYGFTYITMPPFVKYMGPFLLPEFENLKDQHRIFESLESQLPAVDSFNQSFYPAVTNWLPFFWKGYSQNTRYTYRLDISDLDKVRGNFVQDIRKNIKKGEKLVKIDQEGSPEEFYEVLKMTFDRQGEQMHASREMLVEHLKTLEAQKKSALFFARDQENRIHAVCCLLRDDDLAYYHISGSDPKLRKSGAGIFMVWHVMRYAKEEWGVDTFDFEGSMIKNVEFIWHRTGAYQVPYFNIRGNNSRLFSFVERLKRG